MVATGQRRRGRRRTPRRLGGEADPGRVTRSLAGRRTRPRDPLPGLGRRPAGADPAAAGARVTLFDASAGQLDKDRQVAARDRLELACVRGDMRDLSTFADASFDLVFNPISNLYVDDVLPVWRECARVLRPGGKLLASFYNPALFIEDRSPELAEQGLIRPRHRLPYSDLESLSAEALAAKREKGEALVFGHSLTQQIAGQLTAGLLLQDFYEDWQPHPRFVIDRFMPTFLATCALKPRSAAG